MSKHRDKSRNLRQHYQPAGEIDIVRTKPLDDHLGA